MISTLDAVFAIIVGHEGKYAVTASDSGDWTGGRVGSGQCLGTAWGISTASYAGNLAQLPPDVRAHMPLLVRDLTREQALELFRHGYWLPLHGDDLPPPLALLVADAGYNTGVGRAARWLQAAVGAAEDGQIGPATLTAVARAWSAKGGAAVCIEFQARRIQFMGSLPTWQTFGLGWSRRLATLPYQCMTMAGQPT